MLLGHLVQVGLVMAGLSLMASIYVGIAICVACGLSFLTGAAVALFMSAHLSAHR